MHRLLIILLFIMLWPLAVSAQVTNVRIDNGQDKTQGNTTDAKVQGDNDGTVSGKLRGLNHLFNSVWDTGCNCIKVSAASLPLPSGAATSSNQTNGTQQSKITQAVPSSLTTLLNAVTISSTSSGMDISGYASVSFVITGTFDAVVYFEGTIDGTNWFTLTALRWDSGGFWDTGFTQSGSYVTMIGSMAQVRARVTDYVSGSITVKAVASLAMSSIAFKGIEIIPTTPFRVIGSSGNAIDSSVGASVAPPNQVVTGGVYSSTKPTLIDGDAVAVQVDEKGNQLGVLRDAAGNDRGANVNALNQLSVSVENAPIVTANAGTDLNTSALATLAKQSDGSQKTQIVDGSGNVAGLTTNALDINIKSGNPTTITAIQGTGTNLHAVVDSGAINATLQAGSALVGKVGIDQTTPGTTNKVTVGADVVHTIVDSGAVTATVSDGAGALNVIVDSGTNVTVVQPTGTNLHAVLDANSGVDIGKLTANQSMNVSQVGSTAVDTNSGNKSAGTIRVVLATDQPALSNKLLVTPDSVALPANQSVNVSQINGVTTLMGNGTTGTGSQRVTISSDNTANSNPWLAQPVPGTANGANTCVVQSGASTNATNCKNAAGLIYGLEVINTTSTVYYFRLYNLSTSPTCSSSTGFIRTVPIPHASGAGAGIANFYTVGETYGTGIGFCLTGGGSSTDNTNAATGVYITLHYK